MSFDLRKTDPELGNRIESILKARGVQTPTTPQLYKAEGEKIDRIRELTHQIWTTLGLDMTDDSLQDTPSRIAKMLVRETLWGLNPENFPKCTAIENKMCFNQMVVETGITVMSQCEHHGVVIDGKATVAYIPNKKVIGLSKMNRIVEYFSKRPQVQERLTAQILYALSYILETDDVAVVIEAKHYCVASRGVEDTTSKTTTSFLQGAFMNKPTTRQEFFNIVNSKGNC